RYRRADERQHVAGLHGLALAAEDALEDAALVGGHLAVDFLRLELDYRLADGDRLALALQPAAHRRLDHRLAERRNPYLRRHATPRERLMRPSPPGRSGRPPRPAGPAPARATGARPQPDWPAAPGRRRRAAAVRRAGRAVAGPRTATRPCCAALPAARRPPRGADRRRRGRPARP